MPIHKFIIIIIIINNNNNDCQAEVGWGDELNVRGEGDNRISREIIFCISRDNWECETALQSMKACRTINAKTLLH